MHDLIDGVVDADSFFEVKPLFAPELIVGFALLDGRPVGVVASNSVHKGGALFVDSVRQGGPLHLVLRRLRDPARVPGRRPGVHGRAPRSNARGSSATAPR